MTPRRRARASILTTATALVVLAAIAGPALARTPNPPRLPADFQGKGRYLVRDLGLNVPFTWEGRDGNSQMIAGGPDEEIWFTNVIYEDTLYTLTYKWPNIPLDSDPCRKVGTFSRELFNTFMASSLYVGREILQIRPRRRYVHHWRAGLVVGETQPGPAIRIGLAQGDFYVARGDRTRFWQVLHFGLQNLFDPALDEWIRMRSFRHRPGEVELPSRCPAP